MSTNEPFYTDVQMWKVITAMKDNNPKTSGITNRQTGVTVELRHTNFKLSDANRKNLIRSQHKDISVKVDTDIYELDRVQLALKSDYFEKLLTADFCEKDNEFIEICTIDSDTFSTILDIIYGIPLQTVLNVDNYAELLLVMDYLQMEIHLNIFRDFIKDNLNVPMYANVFKLFNSIPGNPNFEYLLPTLLQYFSVHLMKISDCEEFLSLVSSQLIEIICTNQFPQHDEEKCQIGEICAKWICADIEIRLPHIAELVNAAKYRYDFPCRICGENVNTRVLLKVNGEENRGQAVAEYFNRLFNGNGKINPAVPDSDSKEKSTRGSWEKDSAVCIINKIDEMNKFATFLENENFYDITVKADGKIYKLHRCKLNSASEYFARLPENRSDKDKEHSVDGIDRTTFDRIIEYIYFDEIELTFDTIGRVLKASHILSSPNLSTLCKTYMVKKSNLISQSKAFIEVLNFICGKHDYQKEFSILKKVMLMKWPEMDIIPEFLSISIHCLTSVLTSEELEINDEDEILDVCSKWVAHDVKNRYQVLPEIAAAINCNYMALYDDHEMELTTNLDFSQDYIKDTLREMLSIKSVVSSGVDLKECSTYERQQMFISADSDYTIDILDWGMNKIASMCALKSHNPASHTHYHDKCSPSGAIVNDNVFILCKIKGKYCFVVYSLSSNSFHSLNTDPRMEKWGSGNNQFKLLNCRNRVFCCFEDGNVLKYSIELNRWTIFSERPSTRNKVIFSSDGNRLYRIYDVQPDQRRINLCYIVEAFDFKKNIWRRLPDVPSAYSLPCKCCMFAGQITIIGDLALISESLVYLFDRQSQTWREIRIPAVIKTHRVASILTYYESKIVCVTTNRGIYRVSTSTGKFNLVETFVQDGTKVLRAIHRSTIFSHPQEKTRVRTGDIIIQGIPADVDVSTNGQVHRLAKVANIALKKEDIEVVCRLPFSNTDDQPSNILLRFVEEKQKNSFLKAFPQKRLNANGLSEFNLTVYCELGGRKILVEEYLPKEMAARLLRETLVLKTLHRFKPVRNHDGRIVARKSDGADEEMRLSIEKQT